MIIFFLLLSVLLESSVTTLPITLVILLFAAIVERKSYIFILAFLSGLLLDILIIRTLGITSLYFVLVVFITLLYERKFETDTSIFVFGASFIASFFYLLLAGISNAIPNAFFVSVFAALSFMVFRLTNKRIEKYG